MAMPRPPVSKFDKDAYSAVENKPIESGNSVPSKRYMRKKLRVFITEKFSMYRIHERINLIK